MPTRLDEAEIESHYRRMPIYLARASDARTDRHPRCSSAVTLLLAALMLLPGASASPAFAQASYPALPADEAIVRAYAAAWNAGDPGRVAALFAPNAEVRQRAPWLEDGGDRALIRDSYGAEMTVYFSALTFSGSDIVWASGRNDVAMWAAQHMRDGHRLEVNTVQADGGGRLSWIYRASTHAQRRLPGVQPTTGLAEATIADGMLRAMTFETDLQSAQDRIRRIFAAGQYIAPPGSDQARGEQYAADAQSPVRPTIRVGPDDTDARRIVLGSAAALVALGAMAARGGLKPRRR